jgi:hypothetical protein
MTRAIGATRSLALLAASALALMIGACTLDFDRFSPTGTAADASPPDAALDAGLLPVEASAGDTSLPPDDSATADDVTDAASQPPPDAAGPEASCASSACVGTAQTCSATCAEKEKQCSSRCIGSSCRTNCTRTESDCVTGCSSACSMCVRNAGCGAASDCGDAASSD